MRNLTMRTSRSQLTTAPKIMASYTILAPFTTELSPTTLALAGRSPIGARSRRPP